MTVINTNVKALYTQAALKTSGRQHAVAMQQLSTGKRINSAKDDAAGLAIAAHMTAKIRGLNQAVRNAGDAVSLIQTAEGATNTMSDMLQRMSELTIQASNATYSPEQRGFLDEEFQQLKQEISRVSEMHEWNGFPILSGLAGKQVGPVPPLSGAMAPVPGLPTKYKLSSEPTPATAVSYAASNIHAASGLGAVSISGNFAKSGTVDHIEITGSEVEATFTIFPGGASFSLQGDLSADGNTITFAKSTLTDNNGPVTISSSGDDFTNGSLSFTVTRSFTATQPIVANALEINGAKIGASSAKDDPLSATVRTDTMVLQGGAMGVATNPTSSTDPTLFPLANAVKGNSGSSGLILSVAGNKTLPITYEDGADAKAIAAAINTAAKDTGIIATASNSATLGNLAYAGRISMSINGVEIKESGNTTFNVEDRNDLTPMLEQINAKADETGVTASFAQAGDKSALVLTTIDGRDISISGFEQAAAGSSVSTINFSGNTLSDATAGADADPVDDSSVKTGTVQLTSYKGPITATDTSPSIFDVVNVAQSKISQPYGASTADGSAIAMAAAINRASKATGVTATVNANIMTGTAVSTGVEVRGTVTINGRVSAQFSTNGDSRDAVVQAINAISNQTGVVAVADGDPRQGIRLQAADGRNIEVAFNTMATASDFAARTGLAQGLQVGTYSLASEDFRPIAVTGNPASAGLRAGVYDKNQTVFSTATRVAAHSEGDQAKGVHQLSAGDLLINGVAIRGATEDDDVLSQAAAYKTVSNSRAGSAIATATAINDSTAQTGVTATANPASTSGDTTRVSAPGLKSLFVNGTEVQVNFSVGDTADRRRDLVVAAINNGAEGVLATNNGKGVTLSTTDGRNLSVWYDSSDDSISAASFGLGMGAGSAPGVAGAKDAGADFAGAPTVYGTVTLSSDRAFIVEPGVNGFGADANFSALGFRAGSFGGTEAEAKPTPPEVHVGRLSFQVGAGANQVITIDLPDFGKNGNITGELTRDVDDPNPSLNIKTVAGANAILEKINKAIDNVSATRATMGAVMNRLEHVIDNLTNVSVNSEASRSQIEDADYAAASTELARTQIMQQAATAVLAQANTDTQTVMKLLQ